MKIEIVKLKKVILSDNEKATLNQAMSVLENICDKIPWGQKFTNNVSCQDICRYIDGLNFLIGDDLEFTEDQEEGEKITDPFTEKKLQTLDEMIDTRCEMYGVANTLDYLVEQGYTERQLLSLKFDVKDIKEAFERAKEG